MHSSKKQKVISFYGKALSRPTLLLDKDDEPIRNRVDAPEPVTGALLEWARAVPEARGGARPVFKGAPRACLTAFGALVQSKRQELQQGEMHNYYKCETKMLNMDARAAALKEWKSLAQKDRALYQAQAADDQDRWEAEVVEYEKRFPHYRKHLAQKHPKKLNDKGAIDIKLTQLGVKKPCSARHFFIKEQVEKRLKENEGLALEFTAAELFEAASVAKAQTWADMPEADKRKYQQLAEEDKQRFNTQLEGFPQLQGMIRAYEQKQQELKAIKARKKSSSKGIKKRKRTKPEDSGSDAEGAEAADENAEEEQNGTAMEEDQPQIHVTADVGKVNAVVPKADAMEQAADEPVSDTDEEEQPFEPDELLETVAETQNDEDDQPEDQKISGSQGSTMKKRLGMGQFRNFIAGLFTAKKPGKRPAGESQSSQPTQDSLIDDLPPLQNTLASQSQEAVPGKGPGTAATGAAQQSLAEMMQDGAIDSSPAVGPVDSAYDVGLNSTAAKCADAGVASAIETEQASQVPPTQALDWEDLPPTQDTLMGTDPLTATLKGNDALVDAQLAAAPTQGTAAAASGKDATAALKSNSTAEDVALTTVPTQDTEGGASGDQDAAAPTQDTVMPTAEEEEARESQAQASQGGASTAKAPAARQSSSAEKHRRASTGGNKQAKPSRSASKASPEAAPADKAEPGSQGKRDPLIGRCIKKDFETGSGIKAYLGWIIGVQKTRKWYAVQYEDGDTEEFVVLELRKQKLLQPAGPDDRTDFDELDRLYAAVQQQWAQEEQDESK